ncbi:unnamed protein product [Arabis nemorensis]|uniref:RNase H type-1 domain-containing protein n=1 Tax=Arabis nemorensis TaxID=586526 RepID=A0A565AKI2_9BRAS|nr:unnamed protein product [Arabis nemorensis]
MSINKLALRKQNALRAVSKALREAREWQSAQIDAKGEQEPRLSTNLVCAHRDDTVVIHTDGAWKEETLLAGLGWTFHRQVPHSSSLSWLDQGTQSEQYVSLPLMAEAFAIRLALTQAQIRGLSNICLYSDSQILIGAINSSKPIKELFGILQDIASFILLFHSIEFRHVARSQNHVTDSLAKMAIGIISDVCP